MGDYYGYDKSLWTSTFHAAYSTTANVEDSIAAANAALAAFRIAFVDDNN